MTRKSDVRLVALAVLVGFLCFCLQVQAGKLDCVREAVDGDSKNDNDSDNNDSDSDSDFYDEDDGCTGGECENANMWWTCWFPPIGLLVCLPYALIEMDDEREEKRLWHQDWMPAAYFLSRPYADGHPGYLLSTGRFDRLEPEILEETKESLSVYDPGAEALYREDLSSWVFRLSAEYAYDYDPVHRPNLSATIDSVYRIGLSTRWTHYIEPLGDGQTDRITIGDVNLTYRFAQSEVAQVRLGLGYRMIHDGQVSHGINFTYLIDIFPVDPLVISMDGNLGSIGYALYLHGRLTLGAQLGPVEPYLGYDMVLISSTAVGVLFQGPVAGMRIWL